MSSQTLQLITSHRGASFFAADRVDVSLGRLAVRTRRLSGFVRSGKKHDQANEIGTVDL